MISLEERLNSGLERPISFATLAASFLSFKLWPATRRAETPERFQRFWASAEFFTPLKNDLRCGNFTGDVSRTESECAPAD